MEEWKDIDGYEGMYQVSNFGRVRSLDRVIKRATGFSSVHKGKILRLVDRGNSYLFVSLNKGNERANFTIHRGVAEHFLDMASGLDQVNHIDGNKQNNHYTNLEWCTAKQNTEHAFRNNLRNPVKGERHGGTKLSEKIVLEIRELGKTNTHQSIADMFNVSRSSVSLIIRGERWSHV